MVEYVSCALLHLAEVAGVFHCDAGSVCNCDALIVQLEATLHIATSASSWASFLSSPQMLKSLLLQYSSSKDLQLFHLVLLLRVRTSVCY